MRATDRRASSGSYGLLLQFPSYPAKLVTTAIWKFEEPGVLPHEARHVVQWLLPQAPSSLLSDDTWLWPESLDTPHLGPGDWPVMDCAHPYTGIQPRGLTIIDTRNRDGRIVRRFQSFPLVALPTETVPVRIPDVLTLLT